MSIIADIRQAMPRRALVIDRHHVRALRKYVNNAQMQCRQPIDTFVSELAARGPYPLSPVFNEDSVQWMRALILRKDGEARATPNVRRLLPDQILTVKDLRGFYFVGMAVNWGRGGRLHRGHEWVASHAIFRATSGVGGWFDFVHVPWQASTDPSKTGLFPVERFMEMCDARG